ncbi:TonB-dependent receptor [Pseudoalteromonas sp. BDTF-M6]|uniref:TonB-dependent receptor n=1 Tax=Pseudoalteromonas sp. BDTF-M6 TaxID=2796132 RepID=UPI001BAFC7FA|nr:TonB-dependent receptor [Pseudoalteromonas sp. BDTF-M6]MBS3798056.1 TonB-dependent receptor [Pseudoalteromonas sp. BDTF-M6]
MRLVTVTTIIFASQLAFKAEATTQHNTLQDVERITTTASRFAFDDDINALSISTVNNALLSQLGATHIEKALQTIAGANIQHGNGQEYLPALRSPVYTGAGACAAILTLEDGIALRAPGFCNVNELFEAHSEMAQRIEVLKGPGSVLYGSNAVHGVINVITQDPTLGGGFGAFDMGSYGYKRAKLRAGQDYGAQGIGFNASVTRDSGYRDDESVDQEKFNLRHRYDGDSLTLQSGFSYTNLKQQTAGYIEGFESYKDPELTQQNLNPEAFRDNRAMRLWSKLRWQYSDLTDLAITPYARDQRMTFRKHFLPGKPLEHNAQHGVGVQTLLQHRLNERWRLQAGLDAEYTQGSMWQFQESPTSGSAFLQATIPQGKHYDYDVYATGYAPFMALQYRHNSWQANLGARYEWQRYDYRNRMLDGRTKDDGTPCAMGGCRYSRPGSDVSYFDDLSPKLALSYRVNATLLTFANLAKGYRAPHTAELYQLQRQQSLAELDSETLDSLELGVKGDYKHWQFTLSGYLMHKDNVIYRNSDFFNVSQGQTKHRGIELELDYQFNNAWSLQLAIANALHTYTHSQPLGEVDIRGNIIDTAPRLIADSRLNWRPSDDLLVSLQWHHLSDYFTDAENQHSYDGHDLLSLRASWQLAKGWQAIARIENLTDEAYAERADYTSFSGDRYFPGRPRTVLFTLRYQWD